MKFSFVNKLRNKIRVTPNNQVQIGRKTKLVNCSVIIKGKNNRLIIGDSVRMRSCSIEIVGNNCSLYIENNCMIGDNCYLSVKEENIRLSIGKNSALSRNVKIMTSDGHPICQDNKRINPAKNISIGDNVWIADNVTILKGVTVGTGSVVGINSTVVIDIPSAVVAVGNPCRVVKKNITWHG